MTFDSGGRIIRCGMYQTYFYEDITWTIKRKYLPFESKKVLFVRDIPTYSTQNDVKHWIECSLNANERKNGIQCVYKEMNAGSAFIRFGADCDINKCVNAIKRNAFMGTLPKLIILNDENAQKICKKDAWKIGDDDDIKVEIKEEGMKEAKIKEEKSGNKDADFEKKTDKVDKSVNMKVEEQEAS